MKMTKLPNIAYEPILWDSNERISYLPRRNSSEEKNKDIRLPKWLTQLITDKLRHAVREGRRQAYDEIREALSRTE